MHPQSRGCTSANTVEKCWLLQILACGLLARLTPELCGVGARPELQVFGAHGRCGKAEVILVPERRRRRGLGSRAGGRHSQRCGGCRCGWRDRRFGGDLQCLPVVEGSRLVDLGLRARTFELVQCCRDGGTRRRGGLGREGLHGDHRRLLFFPRVARLLLHGEGLGGRRDLLSPAVAVPPAKLRVPERIGVPACWCSELVLRHDENPRREWMDSIHALHRAVSAFYWRVNLIALGIPALDYPRSRGATLTV